MKEMPKFYFALREDLKEEKQFLPTRAHDTDTGYDVRAAMPDRKPLVIRPFQYVKIPLGYRGFLPEGWWYEIKPRSSSFAKKHLHALYGTVDQTFPEEAVFACQYIPPLQYGDNWDKNWDRVDINEYINENELTIQFGEAIAQIIPVKRKEMEVLEWSNDQYNEERKIEKGSRKGGFGSTG